MCMEIVDEICHSWVSGFSFSEKLNDWIREVIMMYSSRVALVSFGKVLTLPPPDQTTNHLCTTWVWSPSGDSVMGANLLVC